jgi:hypothetical protein
MESTNTQPEEEKHSVLKEQDDTTVPQTQEVVISKNKYIPNIASPFLK